VGPRTDLDFVELDGFSSVGFRAGANSDEFKSGGAAGESRSSNWELGNHFGICLATEGNQGNSYSSGWFWLPLL
jgi:hypothetical protein